MAPCSTHIRLFKELRGIPSSEGGRGRHCHFPEVGQEAVSWFLLQLVAQTGVDKVVCVSSTVCLGLFPYGALPEWEVWVAVGAHF